VPLCPKLSVAVILLAVQSAVACGDGRSRAPAASRTPDSGGWRLVFSDEFDTPGALDPARWVFELGSIRNNEKQLYTSRPENVRIEGGNLVIEARKEAYQGFDYTSASVNTRGRFELLYGRVEVRAKLPTGKGTWPAIWMLGTTIGEVGWPTCGEIDIMENVGFDPLRIHASVHTAAYNHTIGTQKTASVTSVKPWEDFHLYALEWSADRIDVFLDGQKYFTFQNEGTGGRAWPFDKPQYLLVNLAIGGSWGGQQGIDDGLFPHRYLIDSVRVYQQQ
jgi:beta-glucanase (GH16 family)